MITELANIKSVTGPAGRAKPRLLLLVSGGWAVRNYLRSGFLEALGDRMEVLLMMPPGDSGFETEMRETGLTVEHLEPISLAPKLNVISGILVDATNHRIGFKDEYVRQRTEAYLSIIQKIYVRLRRLLGVLLSHSLLYRIMRRIEDKWVSASDWINHYETRLDELSPDLVFSTNPYSVVELPVSFLASKRGIPTLAAIVSWDNLSYKGHLLPDFSHYVVWGEMMKQDLQLHLRGLSSARIATTGAPQFDFHLQNDLVWSRKKFFERVGGDASKKLLTWSASPEREFPDEPEVIELLLQAMQDGAVAENPQILVRLHPQDRRPDRFSEIAAKYPSLIVSQPWAHRSTRHWWFTPSKDEVSLLSNTLRYSNVNVNLASSMTLDASILDVPVINIAFTTKPNDRRSKPIKYAHWGCVSYRRIVETGGVTLVHTVDELVGAINMYLAEPKMHGEARQRMVRWICGSVDGKAHIRIAQFVLNICRQGKSVRMRVVNAAH